MDSKLSRWCDGLIEAGWLAALVITPLFFNIHSSRVFEPDKLTLMRSIAVFMAAAWLVKFVDQKGWKSLGWLRWKSDNSIWRMPFVPPVILLIIIYLLSSIFSVTPSVSWAGSYQRLQGTYTTLSYIVIFILLLATLRTREQVSRIVTTVIVVSIPIALYGMLQHFEWDPLPWGGDVVNRIAGNMGNSIFIAAYLIMVLPLTAARIIDAFTNILQDEEIATADVIRSAIYVFALAIQIIAIWWSGSRGPLLGLLASVFTFILILLVTLRNSTEERASRRDVGWAFLLVGAGTLIPLFIAVFFLNGRVSAFSTFAFFAGMLLVVALVIIVMALGRRGWNWLWLSWLLFAGMGVLLLGIFQVPPETVEPVAKVAVIGDTLGVVESWRQLPEVGRYGNLLDASSSSASVRVLIWEGMLDLLAPHDPLEKPDGEPDPYNFLRPVLGYGPESMYVAYNRFYPPELATIEARNASPDRSHNETFDALVITGVAGLIAWQLLYLSVFYYAFKWLGVVEGKRDRNVLIGLYIAGAIAGGLAISQLRGQEYLGVGLPAGTIVGLIFYLVYYAIVSRPAADEEPVNPFGVHRLLLIALVAAVMAHYVEIHFGIAIASTRSYFFVYIALMFLVGYYLPRLESGEITVHESLAANSKKRKGRSVKASSSPGWASPVLSAAFIIALILGVLAFDYSTFSLPSGESLEQLPTAGEIFHQSFLVNAQRGFIEAPFIFLLLFMTWALGTLAYVSELSKQGIIGSSAVSSKLVPGRERIAGLIFAAVAVGSIALAVSGKLNSNLLEESLVQRMAFWLLLIWGALNAWAALRLLMDAPAARASAGSIAFVGLALSLPIIAAGSSLVGLAIAACSILILYLLWDKAWGSYLLPGAVLALVSFGLGLLYAFFHANQIVSGITTPAGVTAETPEALRRVLEANQAYSVLTLFYFFAFLMIIVLGFIIAWPKFDLARKWGTWPGMILAIILIPLTGYFIDSSNLRIIQADIVYKRADPWDKQAGREGDSALWANAISIYERAIDLAPVEDFYYLWLGRAYLEQSNVTEDLADRNTLLVTAENRLIEAQRINPFNTDHKANLARLNTRWAESVAEGERAERIAISSDYYESAMSLSPNNAVIINEYGRLSFLLAQDCEKAMALYEHSIEIDPYYTNTYFDRAEIIGACAEQAADEDRQASFARAAESLAEALSRNPNNPRNWVRLADHYVRSGQPEEAIAAYEEARARAGDEFQIWELDYQMARRFLEVEDWDRALEFVEKALELVPPEAVETVEQLRQAILAGDPETIE